MALNMEKDYSGTVPNATYIALITIMCLGFPFKLLPPVAKGVQSTDGRPVVLQRQPSLASVFEASKRIFSKTWVWALIHLIICA